MKPQPMKKALAAAWSEFWDDLPLTVKVSIVWFVLIFLGLVVLAFFGHPMPLIVVGSLIGGIATIVAAIRVIGYMADGE